MGFDLFVRLLLFAHSKSSHRANECAYMVSNRVRLKALNLLRQLSCLGDVKKKAVGAAQLLIAGVVIYQLKQSFVQIKALEIKD